MKIAYHRAGGWGPKTSLVLMMRGATVGWEHSFRRLGAEGGHQGERRWSSSHSQGVGLTRDSFFLKTQGSNPEDVEMAPVLQEALLELGSQPPVPLTICLPPPLLSPTHLRTLPGH